MTPLLLHDLHQKYGARFSTIDGAEMAAHYGDALGEYNALIQTVGVLDLSFRCRLCLVGADRIRFLHGQVTNDVKRLAPWQGCYAALTTAKGKMQSDLNIYRLEEEVLLDFEPGFQQSVSERLDKYIVADDVQVMEVGSLYCLLSLQGPQSQEVLRCLEIFGHVPEKPLSVGKASSAEFGETYVMNQPRAGDRGFDLFVPAVSAASLMEKLLRGATAVGGRLCGWQSLETRRIESGIPRFGLDMDGTNFPQECGIEDRAVSYSKGCYIGQEVLNRIHTLGHVNRELTGLRFSPDLKTLPKKNDKLMDGEKEVGYVTSAIDSPSLKVKVGLGYVRKEVVGKDLTLRTSGADSPVIVVPLPFVRQSTP
jgi:aminomethyltransferase